MPVTGAYTNADSATSNAESASSNANVAIARELSGWCWSLATGYPTTGKPPPDFRYLRGNGSSRGKQSSEWGSTQRVE